MTLALVVGGFGVDVNVRLYDGQWPLPDADVIFAQITDPSLGHAGSGVALQAAALGCVVTAVDVIGDDEYGEFIRRELAARGVQLCAAIDPAGTRRSVNLVRTDGGRLSLHDPRHAYEMVPDAALWRSVMDGVDGPPDWAHIVIVNWARSALFDARARGILTSTDVQDWNGIAEHHREFAYNADIVFCSATNLPDVAGLARDIFYNGVAQLVVITRGSAGALIFAREDTLAGREPLSVSAVDLPDHSVVDTNGAGDSFAGTFMTALLSGDTPLVAGQKASISAAYAISYPGTNDKLITQELLDSFAGSLVG